MSQPHTPNSNDSKGVPAKVAAGSRATSHVSDRSRQSVAVASKRLKGKKITAFQTFAPHRTGKSNMNMDLQAASIGIDLNEEGEQSCHDAEEAEEPLDHGMKAIAANTEVDLGGARHGNAGEAGESATPELSKSSSTR